METETGAAPENSVPKSTDASTADEESTKNTAEEMGSSAEGGTSSDADGKSEEAADEKANADPEKEETGSNKPAGRKHKKKSGGVRRDLIDALEVIVLAALLAFFVNTFLIANSRVPSESMENTIMTGDRVIGSRLSYKFFGDPERGDVIIFRWPDNEKILFVKRIIGLPGDTVTIRDGHVYLNGSDTPLEEPYIREPMRVEPEMTFTVPEDAYFCMGDNRNESMDARYWKNTYVYRDKIIAKVLFRYWKGFKWIN